MSTDTETEPATGMPDLPGIRDVVAYLPGFLWRVVVPVVVILVLTNLPLSERWTSQAIEVLDVAFMVFMGVVFLLYLRWQVHSIHRSATPQARWIESLIVLGFLFVSVFARSYRILDVANEHAFSEHLGALGSYYYAVTVFSTVGFGDITPKLDLARVFTMVQMIGNLALIGLVVKVLASAGARARSRAS
jgi:voltage-gated potassium channel